MTQQNNTTADLPFRMERDEFVPSKRYYDEKFFELEKEHLWPHVWQMACRLEEIPNVGDWVEYQNLDKSVIVVRTNSGVKAFNNACRHRGVKLASDRGNCGVKGFICPFHGWRWNSDGDNTFVFARQIFSEEVLKQEDIDLVPVRVEEWGGCAFINHDDNAPSLRDSLGSVTRRMESRNVDQLKVEWWESAVLPCNWKLAMEAFMEGYHVMRTHPQLYVLTEPDFSFSRDTGPSGPDQTSNNSTSAKELAEKAIGFAKRLRSGMAGMVADYEGEVAESMADIDLPQGSTLEMTQMFYGMLHQKIKERGEELGLPMFDINAVAVDPGYHNVEFMFPHYFLLPHFSAMASYRIRPLTPETCLFEIWSLRFYAESEERPTLSTPVPKAHDDPAFPEIPMQDYSNLPLQQLGLHAGGFDNMRLSKDYEGLISIYHRLIDGYLTKADPDLLLKAQNEVNQGYDTPIRDIGL